MRFSRSAIAAGLATAATLISAEALSSTSDVLVLGKDNFTASTQNEVSIERRLSHVSCQQL